MGRTAKFTFPVPGRKQKKPVPNPAVDVSAPLTKAQKILGTGELNVDSPVISKDHSKFWESRSNSGISISVSESTTAYTNDTGLGRLDEGEVIHGVSGRARHARWDDESAILPRSRHGAGSRGGAENDTITDASSVRRQRSSSTINTYYDKSKVPLSISQQTASSAMAKGLPAKASALLDMDGSHNMQAKPTKKKPSRLDLSYLIPKNMSSKHLTPPDASHKKLVLGPDMMTRSPSVLSISPDTSSPSAHELGDRRPRKKLTMETLREYRQEPMAHLEPPKMRTASSVNELHNLYEHYEQRSFEEMMGTDPLAAGTGGASPKYGSSSGTGGKDYLSPYSSQASRTTASRDGSNSQVSAETPTTSLMTPSSLKSRPTDSASISSRHTRTSKASKRTDRSMTDLDLRQNSVLSLSSDSEDDYEDRPNTSLSSVPRRPSDPLPSPISPNINNFPQPPSPQVAQTGSPSLPTRRAGPASPKDRMYFSPVDSSPPNLNVTQPKIAARTSSLSRAEKPVSRFSVSTAATDNSDTVVPSVRSARSDDTLREFRPIALIPAQAFRYKRDSHQQSPYRRSSTRLSNLSDRSGTMSPTSMDFYLQSQHNSMAFDAGSIRSTGGGAASMRSSIGSSIAGDDANGRLIAVTRQEEMLLAALRNKRARMRDEIIAEFEEEHADGADGEDGSRHSSQNGYYDQQHVHVHSIPPTKQRLSSDSKRSSGRHASKNSSLSTVRLASLPEQPYGDEQQPQHLQPRPSAPSLRKKPSNISSKSSPRQEPQRVPLYIDHHHSAPKSTPPVVDHTPEPTPDLDDFSDFDFLGGEVTSASAHTTSDTGSSSTHKSGTSSARLRVTDLFPAVPSPRPSPHTSLSGVTLLPKRFDPSQKGSSNGSGTGGGSEEEVDVPRPDSPPISPVADLPKKKQVRLSAVGFRVVEAGLWGDDG